MRGKEQVQIQVRSRIVPKLLILQETSYTRRLHGAIANETIKAMTLCDKRRMRTDINSIVAEQLRNEKSEAAQGRYEYADE